MASAIPPDMTAAGWGRIVNVASSSLFTATPGSRPTWRARAGSIGLTSALANDVGDLGVTVERRLAGADPAPGVEADIAAGVLPADAPERVIDQQAIPRAGVPQDLVGAVCFLASDAASFMMVSLQLIDGGMTRRRVQELVQDRSALPDSARRAGSGASQRTWLGSQAQATSPGPSRPAPPRPALETPEASTPPLSSSRG